MPKKESKPLERFAMFVKAVRAKMHFPYLKVIVHLNRPTLETLIAETPEEVRNAIHCQVFGSSEVETGYFATQVQLPPSLDLPTRMGLIIFEIEPIYYKPSIEYIPVNGHSNAAYRYGTAPYAFIYDAKTLQKIQQLDKKTRIKRINGRGLDIYLPA